ncbi:hypothetical protein [Vreelandella sulfidaeris]|uniref:hypothetical protein n=1 Tax=Vreelandella sulfidaeris TaxID=115553 RepID=UPI0035EB44F0|tara:strand:- start:177 stop:380 length:204 start_codon:yes stop_codon:yes gene_type:complete
MMSLKFNMRFFAGLLVALLAAGSLSGCGESAPPETSAEPEKQEPIDTGPMALDSDPAAEAPGEGVTE